jgi:hypothetical protein
MKIIFIVLFLLITGILVNAQETESVLSEKNFKNPPNQYKPMPFWHINGELTTDEIRRQMKDAHDAGFSGITFATAAGRKKSNKAWNFAKISFGGLF